MNDALDVNVLQPGNARATIELDLASPVTIGRDPASDVVLPSPAVSRFHLRIERVGDNLLLSDQSSNGTYVDGDRVFGSTVSLHGEPELRIGPYTLRLSFRSSAQGEPAPALRRRIHRALLNHLDLATFDAEQLRSEAMRQRVTKALERIIEELASEIGPPQARATLLAEMVDEVLGLGPLQELLEDEDVSEIMVVDPCTIYIERNGRIESTSLRFVDEESCRAVIERIVTPLGRRIDESAPLVDARLEDGSRVNAIIPPLAVRGPCITIRKFARNGLTMDHLLSQGAITGSMATFLKRCVRAKKNVIISGGTGSGKTTLLNILSSEIDPRERIVTIEDAAELSLAQPHVVSLESKPVNLEGSGAYTIRDLVKNALRMRPDRILVGECRGGEAIDMLQAMNTGHEGSMTTTHANSVREAIKRVETLCLMSGLDLPTSAIREQMAASIHVVIQQTRFSDGSRRVTSIAEVGEVSEGGELSIHEVFTFARLGTSADGAILGEHRATGHVPTFVDDFIGGGLIGEDGLL
jgi:pilus assembly protein CpaF